MKYGNELKVGTAIILTAVIFILGIRFFEDLPLFRGTTNLETEFENAAGLIPGNIVRVNGVTVGSVDEVKINIQTNRVRVRFHVDSDLPVPEGSFTRVTGFDALGVVRMDLILGPPENPPIPEGGFVPSDTQEDLLAALSERAPVLVDRVDSVLVGLDATLSTTRALLDDPQSDLRQTLVSARGSLSAFNRFFRAEQQRLSNILAHTDTLTGSLNDLVETQGDSVGVAIQNLNRVLARLDRNLATFESTSASLDAIIARIDRGQGTLGRLINDDALYVKLDSTLNGVNTLVDDFKTHPRKYLRELKLIDIF